MIQFLASIPGWLIAHPWWSLLIIVSALTAFTLLILANPEDRQVRDIWRRK